MTATIEEKKVVGVNLHALMSEVDLGAHKFTNHGEVAFNETVVGKLDDHMRRLNVVRENMLNGVLDLKKRYDALEAEHEALHVSGQADASDCIAHHLHMDEMNEDGNRAVDVYQATDRIFWGMLRLQFPEAARRTTIGLRNEDTVVVSEEIDNAIGIGGLDDLLKRVLGR